MNIIYFLLANWDSVLVVLAFIVLCVVLVKRGETKILKHILFNLVTQAGVWERDRRVEIRGGF